MPIGFNGLFFLLLISIEDVINKMLQLFGKAIIEKEKREVRREVGVEFRAAEGAYSRIEAEAKDGDMLLSPSSVSEHISNYSSDFMEAVSLSYELIDANYEQLSQRHGPLLFVKLANALCMHASLELSIDMKEVANTSMANHVAYNVGGKVKTYSNLMAQTMN